MTPDTPRDDDPHGECRAEIERLRKRLADWENSAEMAADEQCTADEKHCACVGLLRKSLADALAEIERRKALTKEQCQDWIDERMASIAASTRQRDNAQLAAIRAKLESIVCTDGGYTGVTLLGNKLPDNAGSSGAWATELGDALIELWRMTEK